MTLKAAIELDVLEIIAKAGPGAQLSPAEIAAHITTKNAAAPVMLDRILRLLASYSILTCTHRILENGQLERVYGLAPICKFLVRNEEGASMAPLLDFVHHEVFMETWCHLKDAVAEGGVPFDRAYGMNVFEYPGVDARFNDAFNTAMLNHSTIITKKILETYTGFEGLNSLVDVGGGVGVTLTKIVSKYPKINGITFDLPHVVAHAPASSGVEFVGGDMFARVPSGEAIFMKSRTPALLASRCVFQLDLLMLAYDPGGKERTEEEFEKLAKEAGFAGIRKACTAYNMSVLEFYKKM
ncbi:hypothetical protein ACLOJK_028894 [Asimina triloba]